MANGELQPSTGDRVLPQQAVQEFLVLQTRELDFRMEELSLQKQKDANSFEFAKESLVVKKSDRQDQRRHESSQRKAAYIFTGILIFILAVVIGYALHIGKEAFATETLKTLAYIFTSGMGGYGIAKYQAHLKERDDNTGS
jgi:hypothetical protein